jgi:uncharacterized protein YdcH (DUF465 family)
MWFGGHSYWNPPVDGYGSGFYRGDGTYDSDTAQNQPAPPPPTPPNPADTTSPTQDQAKALNQLEGMPEYRQALAELQQAQSEYVRISADVLDKLKKGDAEYQTLLAQRDRAEDQVEAVQASARIPAPEAVTPAAQKKLDLKSKITRKEQSALAADPQARAAKARLTDANERVNAMRQQARGAGAPH